MKKWLPKALDYDRIQTAAQMVMAQPPGFKAAVCVDRGGKFKGKMEWYLAEFKKKHPALNAVYAGPMGKHIDVIHIFSPPCSQN
jgi:hypothetical protein